MKYIIIGAGGTGGILGFYMTKAGKDVTLIARNAHLEAILKSLNNKDVVLYELQGFDHGNVYAPGCYLMLDWIKKHSKL